MSEFLKGLLGGKPANNSSNDNEREEYDQAFDAGVEIARKCMATISHAADPYARKGHFMNASLVIFVAVWTLAAWAFTGVRTTQQAAEARGEKLSPVKRVWDLIRIGMMAETEEEADRNLAQYRREIGEAD